MKGSHILNCQELPMLRDSISYLYVEHAVIEKGDNAIVSISAEGRMPIPVSGVTCLLLGPGTNVTHAAIRIMADSGCMVIWCGEGVGRFYASGLGETRSSANVLAQAKACIPSSMDWASCFSPFCHLMSCPKSLYHIPLEHTGLQIEIFYRFGFGKQPCPQRVLHHIGHNIV